MKLVARGARAIPRRLLPLLRQRPARHRPPGTGARRRAACRGCSSGASRPTATSGARSRCPRSCSATGATPCTRSPTRACSPRSCPTGACWRPTRWSSCACSPERLTDEIASFLDEIWRHAPRRPALEERRADASRSLGRVTAANSSSSLTLTWPGAWGVPTRGLGRLADPQRYEPERFGRVGAALILVRALLRIQRPAERDPGRIGDRRRQRGPVGAVHLHGHARRGGDQLRRCRASAPSSGRSRAPRPSSGRPPG